MNEIERLRKDLRILGQRHPVGARALGISVAGLGLVSVIAIGPWWPLWYPILFLGSLAMVALGPLSRNSRAGAAPRRGVSGFEVATEPNRRLVLTRVRSEAGPIEV